MGEKWRSGTFRASWKFFRRILANLESTITSSFVQRSKLGAAAGTKFTELPFVLSLVKLELKELKVTFDFSFTRLSNYFSFFLIFSRFCRGFRKLFRFSFFTQWICISRWNFSQLAMRAIIIGSKVEIKFTASWNNESYANYNATKCGKVVRLNCLLSLNSEFFLYYIV